jgi:hypothetical protein
VFLDEGMLLADNNSCERAMRPVSVWRKNGLFAGSERGGQAVAFSLIEPAKLNAFEPYASLKNALSHINRPSLRPVGRVAAQALEACMNDPRLIEALGNAGSLELFELSTIIERMLADPRRIIAIRSRLHLGQTVCLHQAIGRSCLHVTQRGHQFPTWELRGRPRTVLGIDQTRGATLRRDYATFTTRRSARSRPEFPVRFAVVRLERSLYQCARVTLGTAAPAALNGQFNRGARQSACHPGSPCIGVPTWEFTLQHRLRH